MEHSSYPSRSFGDPSTDPRYARSVLFRPIGHAGQVKLHQSRVAIVGLGALGTILSTQLVRAGVNFVRLIDRDIIELSNLQRQTLFDEADAQAGRAKAVTAADKLRKANSTIEIEPVVTDLTWRNAEQLLAGVDVIIDGTDNFQVRYLLNEVAVKHGIALSYGGAVSSYGTAAFLRPRQTPCLVCLFGANQGTGYDTCDTVGVLAPIVSIVASFQVAETLKYLTGHEEALNASMVHIDVWSNDIQSIRLPEIRPDCPCCQRHEFPNLAAKQDGLTVSFCGRQTIQVRPQSSLQISLETLAERLQSVGHVRRNPHLLRLEVDDVQVTIFADGRALIHGVDDETRARQVYARYVGM